MHEQYKKLLGSLHLHEPPHELVRLIATRVAREQQKRARLRLGIMSVLSLSSLITLIPALRYLIQGIEQSGFYQYISLAFSDGNIALYYWKEFTLSLAESLPLVATIATLSILFTLLLSIRFVARNIRPAFTSLTTA